MHERKQDHNLLLIDVVPRLVDVSDAVVAPEVDTNVLSGVPEKTANSFSETNFTGFRFDENQIFDDNATKIV